MIRITPVLSTRLLSYNPVQIKFSTCFFQKYLSVLPFKTVSLEARDQLRLKKQWRRETVARRLLPPIYAKKTPKKALKWTNKD